VTPPGDSGGESGKEGAGEANLGAMLRQAREQRNLTKVDLARCLRLEPRVIERLEANQFDQLPAPAFVRGYVRSIAKELGIDSSPLITVYDLRFRHEPPSLVDFESRAPVEITTDSNIIRYTTIALCIVMIMMVALWWHANDRDLPSFKASDRSEPLGADTIVPASDPLPYSFELIVHPDTPFYRARIPAAAATGDAADRTDIESDPVIPPVGGGLSISTIEDAWVEISDAGGKRLHYSLVKPGSDITVTGEQPYSLVIGNSSAVTVTFGGEPVDVAAHSESGVARLRLGSASD
jgi:cytoskeleton protein RodZ